MNAVLHTPIDRIMIVEEEIGAIQPILRIGGDEVILALVDTG